jgi:hypothetical protein
MTVVLKDGTRGTIRRQHDDESVIIFSPQLWPDEEHFPSPHEMQIVAHSAGWSEEFFILSTWLGHPALITSWGQMSITGAPSQTLSFDVTIDGLMVACGDHLSFEAMGEMLERTFGALSEPQLKDWLKTAMVRLARARYAQEG